MNEPDDRFGLCPVCHNTDGYLNVGPNHWFVCDEHLTRWCTSANMFGGWRDESESTWDENNALLVRYKVVNPWIRGMRPRLAVVRSETAP